MEIGFTESTENYGFTQSFAQEVIDNWDYDFWVVKQVPNMECKCVDKTSKHADLNCPLCLGLGNKIKIFKAKGASRESREFEALRAEFPTVTPKIFYIKTKLFIDKQDLIIDNENIYSVYATQFHRGINGEFKFTRCVCPTVKFNRYAILKNFKKLLNEYKRKQ